MSGYRTGTPLTAPFFQLGVIFVFLLKPVCELRFQFAPFIDPEIHVEFRHAEQNQVLFLNLINLDRMPVLIQINDDQIIFFAAAKEAEIRKQHNKRQAPQKDHQHDLGCYGNIFSPVLMRFY